MSDLAVACDPNTSPEILARLAREWSPEQGLIRGAVAAHAKAGRDTLMDLAFDDNADVRRNVAANRATPDDVLALFVVSPHLQRGGASAAVKQRMDEMEPARAAAFQEACNDLLQGRPGARKMSRDSGLDARVVKGWKEFNLSRENTMAKRHEQSRRNGWER